MKIKTLLMASAMVLAAVSAADAKPFRMANQTEIKSLDPYTLNETFTWGMLSNVYEGLINRGPNLEVLPGLAERWETPEPTRWRFYLRKGVKFHNGNTLTADDVLFSADRIRAQGSDLKLRVPADAQFVKVDDHTFDVILKTPNPILPNEWESFFIIDKEWAEANNSAQPTPANATTPSFISLNANGTGAFMVDSHQAGVKTVLKPNPNWWGEKKHNLTEVVFTPISSDATRVASLLTGEVDWIDPVPSQDISRVNSSPTTKAMTGPETRAVYFGMDQKSDELKYSSVKGKNPFKDVRVRTAFYQAIDINAIRDRVMRGMSTPNAIIISDLYFSGAKDFTRLPYDVEAAKKLMAEAGYADGFEITLDCPNDRYVSDEAICQATVAMLARIGVKVNLNAQTKSKYFGKILAAGKFDTSFYMLGWSPGSMDALNVLFNIFGCRDETGKGGPSNVGGYCNPKVDELRAKVQVESDKAKRDAFIKEAFTIITQDVAVIPLHLQSLAWGVGKNINITQRADNVVKLNWITKN